MNITKEEKIKILALRITDERGRLDPLKLAEELYEIKEELKFNRKEINFLGSDLSNEDELKCDCKSDPTMCSLVILLSITLFLTLFGLTIAIFV